MRLTASQTSAAATTSTMTYGDHDQLSVSAHSSLETSGMDFDCGSGTSALLLVEWEVLVVPRQSRPVGLTDTGLSNPVTRPPAAPGAARSGRRASRGRGRRAPLARAPPAGAADRRAPPVRPPPPGRSRPPDRAPAPGRAALRAPPARGAAPPSGAAAR